MNEPLLDVQGLSVQLPVRGSMRTVLDDISLAIRPGEALGLVGESGSGKSMTARAIGRLLPKGAQTEGTVRFRGRDVGALAGAELRSFRGQVAMIFQDPRAHVNPVRRIGDFMTEALRAAEPRILILDESVAALDVSIQAQVLNLLADIRAETGVSYLLISHDLAVVRQLADTTIVLRRGQVVERGPTGQVLDDPQHDYTKRLRASVPRPGWKPTRQFFPSGPN